MMFTKKWRIVHRKNVTTFTVLSQRYRFRATAERDCRALNAARDDGFIATFNRVINGSDVYIVASVREVVAMELERARMLEIIKHETAAKARTVQDHDRKRRLADGTHRDVFEPRSETYVPEAYPTSPMMLDIPHEPWRGRRGKPIQREHTDESLADGGVGICREPRAAAPADEHDVGRGVSGDVPSQGPTGADQQCDGQPSTGDAGSSDCGASGSYGTD